MAASKLRPGTKYKLYNWWLRHPQTSYAKVGRRYGVSRQRVGQIVLEFRDNHQVTEEEL